MAPAFARRHPLIFERLVNCPFMDVLNSKFMDKGPQADDLHMDLTAD